MGMTCSVCNHEDYEEINQRLVEGGASSRVIATQYRLSQAAVVRHAANHLNQKLIAELGRQALAEKKIAARREERETAKNASRWITRLEQAYDSAKAGIERSENTDGKEWTAGSRYIMAAAKLIETGLRVDGIIEGGGATNGTTINVEQVLVLPSRPAIEQEEIHKLPYGLVETYVEPEPES